MVILSDSDIRLKVKRLAFQVLENNFDASEIYFMGINNKGQKLAQMLIRLFESFDHCPVIEGHIKVNPANPIGEKVTINHPIDSLVDKNIILVDDVANTGRTLFYACKPLLQTLPKRLETVVLVDRKHKSFPIKVDYMGMSLATTLKNNIRIEFSDDKMTAYLE